MRKDIIWFMVLILCAGLIAGCIKGPMEPAKEEATPHSDTVSEALSQRDVATLERIIESSADSDTRQRAVAAVTDVAMMTSTTEDVVTFLKKVATSDEDSSVRSAAYANLALIREQFPLEKKGTLDLRIEGTIAAGQNIAVIATVTSPVNTEKAMVGIRKIVDGKGERTGDISLVEVYRMPIKVPLFAGSPKEIPLILYLSKEGKYSIFYFFKMDLDRVESQVIEKEVYIYFENGVGKYQVIG